MWNVKKCSTWNNSKSKTETNINFKQLNKFSIMEFSGSIYQLESEFIAIVEKYTGDDGEEHTRTIDKVKRANQMPTFEKKLSGKIPNGQIIPTELAEYLAEKTFMYFDKQTIIEKETNKKRAFGLSKSKPVFVVFETSEFKLNWQMDKRVKIKLLLKELSEKQFARIIQGAVEVTLRKTKTSYEDAQN